LRASFSGLFDFCPARLWDFVAPSVFMDVSF
jgi:hypothetical protein